MARVEIRDWGLGIRDWGLGIGDKLRLKSSCQVGLGDKSRDGLALLGRGDLIIPRSRFSGAVR